MAVDGKVSESVKENMPSKDDSEGTESVVIREGKAEIRFLSSNEVFYNPVQEFNRDLSTAVLRLFSELTCETAPRVADSEESENVQEKQTAPGVAESEASENVQEKETGPAPRVADSEASEESENVQEKETAPSEESEKVQEKSGLHAEQSKTDVGLKILEGLSASGLRSVRYALEVPGIQKIVANDISADAFKLIKENIKYNGVEGLVYPSQEDASMLLYKHRYPSSSHFHVIDIDPYGSASTFLDSAVQAIIDGGILMITCTDMGVLCGNHSEACYGKYGGMSLKAKFCHEMALRLLLSCIQSHANRYKRYIVPLLSISVDFYIRVFVQVFTSALEVKRSASKKSLVYHCVGCGCFHFQPMGNVVEKGKSKKYPPATGPPVGQLCDQCNQKFHLGGPIWTQPIHDTEFVKKLLAKIKSDSDLFKTSHRMIGLLSVISEELQDCPLYYTLDRLSSVIHCTMPQLVQLRSAIMSLGYRVSSSHACPLAIKTDAPHSVMWDIMRCWEKLHPAKRRNERAPGTAILKKEPEVQASFDPVSGANPSSRRNKLVRFQENPEANWGPKARAKRKREDETLEEKQRRLQGKRCALTQEMNLKQFMCKQFKAGNCEYGDKCQYSHDPVVIKMEIECTDNINIKNEVK